MTVREQLKALLAEQGFAVLSITRTQGRARRRRVDMVTWEATASTGGSKVSLMSYSTMSDCVRYGIRIEPAHGSSVVFEVIAFHKVAS